ncbi:YbdK family carboxylate-amine ligase [Pimelobacter simplex]|uniref:Putative glutamate--cysteine ligase 2 n=1 Tax=Nocardioides simplex TaxID=2045 RepID=A0A7J5DZC9_NOCSI|nr:glutamate--cysteine ligase [Pimelobacter simplex]KAB2811258.1 YbdK family carboxylate-amine ligase [Pimelobacter simplex]
MDRRTVGVEEELLLIDPESRLPAPRAEQVLKYAREHGTGASDALDHELFRHQLETRTPPVTSLDDLRRHLVGARRDATEAAAAVGLAVAASGAVPLGGGDPRTSPDDRYRAMVETYGEVARPGGTCGLHVHVAIDSDDDGVRAIDTITPWLPVLLAISANSPFHHGRDTRYASWRSQVWTQWPSAGPTAPFGSAAGYREASRRLIASGAALDPGMLYYDARLSESYPTVEVRITDVCTDPDEAVLIAALVRGLVDHALATTSAPAPWRAELLRAARWRAARYGLTDRLLDPRTGRLAPARAVAESLVHRVRDHLDAHGDTALVDAVLPQVLAEGGATRQRAAYERGGGNVADVVDDLVARTGAAWRQVSG